MRVLMLVLLFCFLVLLFSGCYGPVPGSATDCGYGYGSPESEQTFLVDTAGLGVSHVTLSTVEYDGHTWITVL